MLASLRAGFIAALVTLVSIFSPFLCPPFAADKPFSRDDLADAAIKLEAQIKEDAGAVAKPIATLRREADAAFARNDVRTGMQILAQIVAVAPNEAANWLHLARTIMQIRAANDTERTTLLERAATAAYIGYLRAGNRNEEAEALLIIGRSYAERKIWRTALDALRLSLELREVADVRAQYERLREDHGFRLLDYTVDSGCGLAARLLPVLGKLPGKRTDLSPFVAVGGQDRPALSVEEKQLCIEGLRHGERYFVTLRAGMPSTVQETLSKSADFNIYVRDRKPFVRFTSKAYVLPKTGQRGIPVVTVNTESVKVEVYRVGDRNLINTVLGNDFQRSLASYELSQLSGEKGSKVWQGDLKVELSLNADVTTAFPISEAVGDLQPGVYVMSARPGNISDDDYQSLATQWFIISDLGLTAYTGNDGVTAFIHSLATTDARAGIVVRLLARNNEILAERTTDANGMARFEPGLARGEGGLAPALLIAADPKGDYAFLNLKGPAFDLTDRGVSGRVTPAGLDAFVYPERGVYRTGETVHITALLRDAQGFAAPGVPMTMVVERPDGVEYKRMVVPDQGQGGRSLSVAIVSTAPTGTWRVRTYTDPKRPSVGEATFLVEDYVPDRLEFTLASPTGKIAKTAPAEVTLDGRFLYGAPASGLTLEGEVVITAARERPGLAGYTFGLSDEENVNAREPLENLPETDAQGKASFTVALDKVPASTRPLEATVTVRMAEQGGRAVERKLTLPVTPTAAMIGVKPQFAGKSLGEGDTATFDVLVVGADGKPLARPGLRWELVKIERRYQWYRGDGSWQYEPVKSTRRIADGKIDVAAETPGRIAVPVTWGRYRLDLTTDDPAGPVTSISFDAGWYAEASADTPDMLEIALDKPEYKAGEAMTVAVTARTAGKVTLNVVGDRLLTTTTADVQAGHGSAAAHRRSGLGQRRLCGRDAAPPARCPGPAHAGPRDRRAMVRGRPQGAYRSVDLKLPDLVRPSTTMRIPVKIGGLNRARKRAS